MAVSWRFAGISEDTYTVARPARHDEYIIIFSARQARIRNVSIKIKAASVLRILTKHEHKIKNRIPGQKPDTKGKSVEKQKIGNK